MRPYLTTIILALATNIALSADGPAWEPKTSGDDIQIWRDGRLVVEYATKGPYKPYIKRFASPAGVQVLRDAPADHLHHHALMFAIAADKVDFWAETPGCGKQVTRSTAHEALAGKEWSAVRMGSLVDWANAQAQNVLVERREVAAYNAEGLGASLLTWRTSLRPAGERQEVELGGSHYFGLGLRFVESMDANGTWIYPQKRSEAVVVRGDERLVRSTWCGYSAKADGKDVTVAMFDHPDNARHPSHWFTMARPFAYIAATLNLWKEPMKLERERPLMLRYGVAVWDGQVEAGAIEKVYRRWLEVERQERMQRPDANP